MALIKCPNCGKSVSSIAETCVHCGCVLNKLGDVRNYKLLNSSEKGALQKEFGTLNPEFVEYEKEVEENTAYFNKYSRVMQIMAIVSFFSIAGTAWVMSELGKKSEVLSKTFSENPVAYLPVVVFGIGVVCFFGMLVLGIVRFLLVKKINDRVVMNELIMITKYKAWLKETKNIDYEITGIKDKYIDYIRDFEYDGVDKIQIKRG